MCACLGCFACIRLEYHPASQPQLTAEATSLCWCRYSTDERLQLVSHWQLPSEDVIGSAGKHAYGVAAYMSWMMITSCR